MPTASIRSVKLDHEETERVRRQARALGMYEHGFMRTAIRLSLGLSVPKNFADHVAGQIRATTGQPLK